MVHMKFAMRKRARNSHGINFVKNIYSPDLQFESQTCTSLMYIVNVFLFNPKDLFGFKKK